MTEIFSKKICTFFSVMFIVLKLIGPNIMGALFSHLKLAIP